MLKYCYRLTLMELQMSYDSAFTSSFMLVCMSSGQISVQRCILTIRAYKSRCKEGADAFIEEAVVRRELADNFCFYNHDHYDSIKGRAGV